MLFPLFTLVLVAVCSATKPTNSTLLQHMFHGKVSALNKTTTQLYAELHDALAQSPGIATALKNQTLDEVQAEMLRIAQQNITLNSPICANASHLPIRKCLHRSNASTTHELRHLINVQKHACESGLPSLTNFTFYATTCFDVQDSSCAAKAAACLRNFTQELDTQLLDILTQPLLHKRDSNADTASLQQANTTALLQGDRKRTIQLVVVGTTAFALIFFWFILTGGPFLVLLPLIFIAVMLGLNGKHLADLNRNMPTLS